jgi:hypothetical protein
LENHSTHLKLAPLSMLSLSRNGMTPIEDVQSVALKLTPLWVAQFENVKLVRVTIIHELIQRLLF